MRTSHKAKDAAAEKQSYVCDTFTGHGKAHQPPLPGFTGLCFPAMLLGKLFANPGLAPEDRPWRRSLAKAATHTYREPDTSRGAIRGITTCLLSRRGLPCR